MYIFIFCSVSFLQKVGSFFSVMWKRIDRIQDNKILKFILKKSRRNKTFQICTYTLEISYFFSFRLEKYNFL